ncbi:MAG: hypothetical protein ACHQ4F_06960 [Candidatus Dormibacteria bacterium]
MKRTTIVGTAIAALGLAACGSTVAPSVTPTRAPTVTSTPAPAATPVPTPSPTPAPPQPLVVTAGGNSATSVRLSLVGENGSVVATVDDPGGVDGHAYYIGSDDVYFLDGTTVKAFGRSGTVSVVGQVPQVKTSVTAADLQHYTTFAVSPDQTTLVFGIPVAMTFDNGATTDHSQLWTEPTGGTAADATMVYDDANNIDNGGEVLMPFAWSTTGISVSEMCKGLGGVGPFLEWTGCAQATFNPTTRTLTQVQVNNTWGGYLCPATVAPGSVCVTLVGSSSLKVVRSSGNETIALYPANAAAYGPVSVSADGRYLAYGAYVGTFDSGYYVTTVVDLSTKKTVSTVRNFAPEVWLHDDRLVGWDNDYPERGATWLLSAAFTSRTNISPAPAVGALGVLPAHIPLA